MTRHIFIGGNFLKHLAKFRSKTNLLIVVTSLFIIAVLIISIFIMISDDGDIMVSDDGDDEVHAVNQNAEEIIRRWIDKHKDRPYPVKFYVKDYNPETHVLTLRKEGADPTDSGCWLEAQLYVELCSLEDQTVKVFVTGEKPMSSENPIDYEWACFLESLQGKPFPPP